MTLAWPLNNYIITQEFGENPANYKPFGYPGHNGLDLATFDTRPFVFSIDAGVIESVSWEEHGFGKYIILKHSDICRSYYAHLDEVYVLPGQVVVQAQPIALMGSTGFSSGPHLHLGIRFPNSFNPAYKGFVDPLPYLHGSASFSSCQSPALPSSASGRGGSAVETFPVRSVLVKAGPKKTVYRMRRFF